MDNTENILVNGLLSIKEGLSKGDFQLISDGYFIISGERISPPTESKSRFANINIDLIRNAIKASRIDSNEKASVPPKSTDKRGRRPKKTPTREVNEQEVIETIIENNDRKITVISNEEDDQEKKENELLARKKISVKRRPSQPLTEKFKNENGDVRYKDGNDSGSSVPLPPWR